MNEYRKSRGGRPMVNAVRYREYMVSTRLDAGEHLKLEELKMKSGKQAAQVVRELIARGWVRERMRRIHLDLMAQLKGVARNLNQLTRLANAAGYKGVESKHRSIIGEIEQILKQFRDDR